MQRKAKISMRAFLRRLAENKSGSAAAGALDPSPADDDRTLQDMKIAFFSSEKPAAIEAATDLKQRYEDYPVEDCDVIVAVGGDGAMLDVMRAHMTSGKPIYGFNRGTVGFLMNAAEFDGLRDRIAAAEPTIIHPLLMTATTISGETHTAKAINEVSLFRETRQSARVRITVNGKVRMDSLTCDGILAATPAGSTAYNLSAHGPILPISAQMLAVTPISAFRPRRWRGAILPHDAIIEFEALEPEKRPVSAVADNQEVRDVRHVEIRESRDYAITILFDQGQSLDERILREQFNY